MDNFFWLRNKFIDYFKHHDHELVQSSSLIPHTDQTLLFTNSGMVQFKNIFLGLESTHFNRIVTVQKCLRAGGKHNDLDNVGFTNRHHTFFEMLGNFSFGDYFKEKAIYYAYNFITKEIGIDTNKLIATVYYEDQESHDLWKKIAGFSDDRIIKIKSNDNFWSMGDTGPCGPCTELFYDYGPEVSGGMPGQANQDGPRFTEIWNVVFMQYNRSSADELKEMTMKSVDTGMGLERLSAVVEGVVDNYDTKFFTNIILQISELLKVKTTIRNKSSFKVIADHIRSIIFMISDGIIPSNEGRGYVLRRIIRRTIRHGYVLGNSQPIFYRLVPYVIDCMKGHYLELSRSQDLVVKTLKFEEEKFSDTIHNGMKLLHESIDNRIANKILPGEIAFKLYDTYGFPLDLTEDILKNKDIKVDVAAFDRCMLQQKEQSKKSWIGSGEVKDSPYWFELKQSLNTNFVGYENLECTGTLLKIVSHDMVELSEAGAGEYFFICDKTVFYPEGGGQIGDRGWFTSEDQRLKIAVLDTQKVAGSLIIHKVNIVEGLIKVKSKIHMQVNPDLRNKNSANHTATHLMLAALKKIKGKEVNQQGSLVNSSFLRVDVYVNDKISAHDLQMIEIEVNKNIISNFQVGEKIVPYSEAITSGAAFLLGESYPDMVRVVNIDSRGDDILSMELCGGTHVKYTGEIGLFKITSESAIKAGTRRIEAVTGLRALELFQQSEMKILKTASLLKATIPNINDKIQALLEENKDLKQQLDRLYVNNIENSLQVETLKIKGDLLINILTLKLDHLNQKQLKDIINKLLILHSPALLIITCCIGMKINFIIDRHPEKIFHNTLAEIMHDLKSRYGAQGGGGGSIQGSLLVNNEITSSQDLVDRIKILLA